MNKRYVCPKCQEVYTSEDSSDVEVAEEFQLHVETFHQGYLMEHPDFNVEDHLLEGEDVTEPEQLAEVPKATLPIKTFEQALSESRVNETEELMKIKALEELKEELGSQYDRLSDAQIRKAVKDKMLETAWRTQRGNYNTPSSQIEDKQRHLLMEFMANRKRIHDNYCVFHPETKFEDKTEYLAHIKACQPEMLSKYDRIHEFLTRVYGSTLKLPEPTAPDYGALVKDYVDMVMTTHSAETFHEVIGQIEDKKNLEQCSEEIRRREEFLSAEAKELGLKFENVPLFERELLIAFLKDRKKREKEPKQKSYQHG